jgi:hypothetical protein
VARNIVELILRTVKQGDGIEETTESFDGLNQIVGVAKTALGALAANELLQVGFELAQLGAEAQRTEIAFENISGGADAASANLAAMQRATRGTVSDMELMAQANRLLQMGLADNADGLENLANTATRLGTAMGLEATDAIEQFSLTLANQSLPRLDSFGISSGRVRQRINDLMNATDGLTREQAFLEATMEEAEIAMQRLGDTTGTAAEQIDQARASFNNLKVVAGELALILLGPAIDGAEQMLTQANRLANAIADEELAMRREMLALEERVEILRQQEYIEGSVVDQEVRRIDALLRVYRVTQDTALANYELNRSLVEIPSAAEGAADGLGILADEEGNLVTASGAALGSVQNLFSEIASGPELNADAWYQLALSMGATHQQALDLGLALGQFTEAEYEARIAQADLVQQFLDGQITIEQFREGVNRTTTEMNAAEDAAAREAGALQEMDTGMIDVEQSTLRARDAQRDAIPAINDMGGALGDANNHAGALSDSLNRLDNREISIDIFYNEHGQSPTGGGVQQRQGGGTIMGGPTLVGEGGPEILFAPGSFVVPAPTTRQILRQTTMNRGGDTYYVTDPTGVALIRERQRREQMDRAGQRFMGG